MNLASRIANKKFVPFAVILLLFFTGCATQLAPPYDKSVTDQLNAANTKTMTLFAVMSAGTKATDYDKRADNYASLIGELDSLVILAGARPMPKNKLATR